MLDEDVTETQIKRTSVQWRGAAIVPELKWEKEWRDTSCSLVVDRR